MPAALQRIFEIYPAQPQATAPLGLRVNDMVYAGDIAGVDPVSGASAGELREQMQAALAHLARLMEQAGGSLDNVARVTGYVTRPEDREPIYEPWDALFPDPADRPAFKALVAPLPAGRLVRLDAVGLIGARRTRTDIPNVPARDPTVKIGNWVFSSRCHGNDPQTGQIVTGGLEAETRQTLANLITLAELAGGSASSITQVTMFGHDAGYIEPAQRVFEQCFPDPATRPALHQLVNVVTARFATAIEMAAGLNGEPFQEIYLCPERNSLPAGVRLGPLLLAPWLTAADPCTGTVSAEGLEAQLRAAFANMDRFLEAAGAGRDDVARVTVFMADVGERPVLNRVWSEIYPEPANRPPHKYVQAALPEGELTAVQVLALPGAARRVLVIPGLVHGDPMSMGALTGNLVTSSRIFAGRRYDDLDQHTAALFESAATMLRSAGGDLSHLTQVTAFVGGPEYRDALEHAWEQAGAGTAESIRLHVLETDLGGNGWPRIEILGLV